MKQEKYFWMAIHIFNAYAIGALAGYGFFWFMGFSGFPVLFRVFASNAAATGIGMVLVTNMQRQYKK